MKYCIVFFFAIAFLNSNDLLGQEKDTARAKESNIIELLEIIQKTAMDSSRNGLHDSLFIEIDQLIINETISKLGHDFQEIFYSKWTWPAGLTEPFFIIISERPVFGTNTQIEIQINDITIFQNFLQPRYEILEEIALQATEITRQYILNFQEYVKQLSGEDMSGTGIY